jgi:hypothetical protein
MGSEAAAAAVNLLRSQVPLQTDGELVLPSRGGVGLVLVDISNGFCTVGAGNLVSRRPPPNLLLLSGLIQPLPTSISSRGARLRQFVRDVW